MKVTDILHDAVSEMKVKILQEKSLGFEESSLNWRRFFCQNMGFGKIALHEANKMKGGWRKHFGWVEVYQRFRCVSAQWDLEAAIK